MPRGRPRKIVPGLPGVEEVKGARFTSLAELPALGPKQKYFESPDGRVYAGPAQFQSIPDPDNPNIEINAQRR